MGFHIRSISYFLSVNTDIEQIPSKKEKENSTTQKDYAVTQNLCIGLTKTFFTKTKFSGILDNIFSNSNWNKETESV